jgi:tetratricopeptide (TPR) repeat protein
MKSVSEDQAKSTEDRVAVLSIAYHNLGVELEYLKRFEEAIQTYQKAVRFASQHLAPNHQLVLHHV